MLNLVLVEPEIAPNTGNIGRLCAATGTRLHLIEPLGFQIDDRQLKRAGMDYWKSVDYCVWPNWNSFRDAQPADARLWYVESNAPTCYWDATFADGDYLLFGRESAGLPKAWLETHPHRWIDIPMTHPAARSLNLSNCAAIVLYEALRQIR
jgi:tRNA (cytidine/uridine-2'-O-)-methyltransferase